MHNILKRVLPYAEGRSEYVVAVVADIRGFSEFSSRRESPDIATYIKRVYVQLISRYFPDASFYKPTGDGLVITISCNDRTLRAVAAATVAACLQCVEDFPNICASDDMVNFEVPTRIAFGVARGTACCLVASGLVLDYSGHVLNLTSRLTDLARPSGIVIDGEFGLGLLSDQQQSLFEEDQVCVRGVSEEMPRTVYIQKDVVEIPEAARRPLRPEEWERIEVKKTIREWRLAAPKFRVRLAKTPKRRDGIRAEVVAPVFRSGKKVRDLEAHWPAPFDYVVRANRPLAIIRVDEMLSDLRQRQVPASAQVTLVVDYVPE